MREHRAAQAVQDPSQRAAELEAGVEAVRGIAEEADLERITEVLERIRERSGLHPEYTVVGFFGATGSGKSSLFNRVAGRELSRVSAVRPATSTPTAAVWGQEDPTELLEWLEVERIERMGDSTLLPGDASRAAALPGDEGGLILVDLPDVDSIRHANREVVERFAARTDVMVWVLDPQKYADAVVHTDFIRPLARHGGAMLAVLNQADRLAGGERDDVLTHLGEQLERDGAARHLAAPPWAVSAATGEGLGLLTERIAAVAEGKHAVNRRLAGDLDAVQEMLEGIAGEQEPRGLDGRDLARLAEGLYEAVGADSLVQAAQASRQRAARTRTGWPPVRWLSRLRRDPLRRAGITRRTGETASVSRLDLPPLDAAGRARAGEAIREAAREAAGGVEEPWRHAVRAAATTDPERLSEDLERAVAGTDFTADRPSWWWAPLNVLQWLSVLAVAAGLVWLTGLAVADYFRLELPEPPLLRGTGVPVPTGLMVAGLLLGFLLTALGTWASRASARRWGARVREDLLSRCARVGRVRVAAPVDAVVERHLALAEALARAGAARGPEPRERRGLLRRRPAGPR